MSCERCNGSGCEPNGAPCYACDGKAARKAGGYETRPAKKKIEQEVTERTELTTTKGKALGGSPGAVRSDQPQAKVRQGSTSPNISVPSVASCSNSRKPKLAPKRLPDDYCQMMFGKFQGRDIGKVPASYLLWCEDQLDRDGRDPKMWEYIECMRDLLEKDAEEERRAAKRHWNQDENERDAALTQSRGWC